MTVNAREPIDSKPQRAAMSSADLSAARFEVSRAAPGEWPVARAARLRALVAEPERFGVSLLSEETRTADEWRQPRDPAVKMHRMIKRITPRRQP
jgi:hypothetical protein